MGWMFNECHKLKEIKGINNFNTINIMYLNSMFQGCKSLEYLDLSKFNTMNVTDISFMFNQCHKLKEIKGINDFNFIKVIDKIGIFDECNELKSLSEFNNVNINNNSAEIEQIKKEMENMFTVNFISTEYKIDYPIQCKSNDKIKNLENKLYIKYPKLKYFFLDFDFLANENIINKYETLENCRIIKNTTILIKKIKN